MREQYNMVKERKKINKSERTFKESIGKQVERIKKVEYWRMKKSANDKGQKLENK